MTKLIHDSEILAQGQQVITACAFIHRLVNDETQLFLARRAKTKKFLPNVFELPGGHINYSEDIVEGLKREIKEEFNINVTIGDPFAAFTYQNPIKGSYSIEVIYFAMLSDPDEKIKFDPEYHSEYRWITRYEVGEIISLNHKGDDPEMKAIQKGFSILDGNKLNFGLDIMRT